MNSYGIAKTRNESLKKLLFHGKMQFSRNKRQEFFITFTILKVEAFFLHNHFD